ncbi:hypothetical protein COCNU_10G007180 [Cocos nucifera]|uniref:Uncharacterized protein n=1 Tax=Cocos nucifera TaxID=13894 RepID=A0A8K0N918_COCNU|nr:hypothetical protein COCNU_10G007180 [Cocos nucifera]
MMAEDGDWTTILSFLIAICAIVIATFSTGIDTQSFQFRKDDIQSEDDVPYSYEIFHFIFSMGAMYFAMLFISWELDQPTRKYEPGQLFGLSSEQNDFSAYLHHHQFGSAVW